MRLTRRRTLAAWAIAVGALSAGAVATNGDLDGDDASAVAPAPAPPTPGAPAAASATPGEAADTPTAPPAPAETAPSPAPATMPAATATDAEPEAVPASVTVSIAGFPVTATGTVRDTAARDEVVEHLRSTFGLPRVIDRLEVDEAAAAAPWLTAFLAALPGPNAGFAELTASTDGTRLVLEGEARDAATRREVVARARSAASPPLAVVDRLELAPPPPPAPPAATTPTETDATEPPAPAAPAEPAAPPATSPAALQRRLDQRLDGVTVAFEPGSATLTGEGEAALERIVRPLQRATGVVVEVQGHTDSEGGAPGNLLLSQDRAEAVVAFLVERGVPIELLAAKGYGETRPRATNDTEDGRARNRRIELVVRRGAADVG